VHRWAARLFLLGSCFGLVAVQASAHGLARKVGRGGVVRITLRSVEVPAVDPARAYSEAGAILLDTTCARLLTYASGAQRRLVPEVATGFPQVSRDGKPSRSPFARDSASTTAPPFGQTRRA
jgi:hypothetical protein